MAELVKDEGPVEITIPEARLDDTRGDVFVEVAVVDLKVPNNVKEPNLRFLWTTSTLGDKFSFSPLN